MPRGGCRPNAGRKKITEGMRATPLRVPQRPTRRRPRLTVDQGVATSCGEPKQDNKRAPAAVYNPDVHPAIVRAMASAGLGDHEMADVCGVTLHLFDRWIVRHPEFAQAHLIGNEQADARVERALYRRAVGYDSDDAKVIVHEGEQMVIRYRRHRPPDVSAIKFWLCNRKRDVWQNNPEAHPRVHCDKLMGPFAPGELERLDDESLANLLADHIDKDRPKT